MLPCALALGLLSGCLYSTQHFKTGLLLPAGQSEATVGVGHQPLWRCKNYFTDSLQAAHACREDVAGKESVNRSTILKGSLDYRLGIRDGWGPFPGAELQWHMEMPTNPASMEFGLNLALPSGPHFHHALGLGWGIGAWADNSFYLDYALSRQWGLPRFFGNARLTYLATQIGDVVSDDFAKPLPRNQVLVWQSGIGLVLRLPDWIVVPDFIIPQFHITYPFIPPGDIAFLSRDLPLVQWDMNFGFGWGF